MSRSIVSIAVIGVKPSSHTVHHQKLGFSRVSRVSKIKVYSVTIRVRFSFRGAILWETRGGVADPVVRDRGNTRFYPLLERLTSEEL